MRFVASGRGSEYSVRLTSSENRRGLFRQIEQGSSGSRSSSASSEFEWKTEDGRGHVTAFLSTTMAASAAGPTFNDFH